MLISFGVFLINLRYIPQALLKQSVTFLMFGTWTGYFSNSIGSYVTTQIIPFSTRGIHSQTHTILLNLKSNKGKDFHWVITKFVNTCSTTIHFKKINACSKVFVECTICFGEFKKPPPPPPPNTKRLKRACIQSFHHLETLDSRNPRSYGDNHFTA